MTFLKLTQIIRSYTYQPAVEPTARAERVETVKRSPVYVNMARVFTIDISRAGDTELRMHDTEEGYCAVYVVETPEEILARIK